MRKVAKKHILNLRWSVTGSVTVIGSVLTSTFISCRAFGGRRERNIRAVFAGFENGLKRVDTSVRKREIIMKRRQRMMSATPIPCNYSSKLHGADAILLLEL